jgi:hypothetical protein
MTCLRRRHFLAALAWAAVVLSGCGKQQDQAQNEAVEGTIQFEGQPLAKVGVEFYPVPKTGVTRLPSSTGFTDAQGRYKLTCENKKPGAVIGKHRVVVRLGRADDPDTPSASLPIPSSYLNASQTTLEVDITADKHVYDLNLKNQP